jgi:hypothetical protein|tara:strand:+ start:1564 stop:2469 length:906 start_codon:yes stop_codon:yes gene_type:complete
MATNKTGLKNIPKIPVPKFNKPAAAPAAPQGAQPQQGQLQINIDELRKEKIFVATPCYGGMLTEAYFRSMVRTLTFFNQHQIPIAFGTIANESLVTRARNVLVAYFLQSNYSRLLFIDADIEFQVEDVLKLIAHNKEVCVGAYPKKGVNWQRIKEHVVRKTGEEISDRDIAAAGSDYAINFKFVNRDMKQIAIENGVIKLHDGATGFMMIKREAIDKMIAAYPELKYNNDLNTPPDLQDFFYAFFDTMIDPVDRRYLSEDYTFSRRWQGIGGDIWLDPTISLNHFGSFNFQGNPAQIIQIG